MLSVVLLTASIDFVCSIGASPQEETRANCNSNPFQPSYRDDLEIVERLQSALKTALAANQMAMENYSVGLGPDHVLVAVAQENYSAVLRVLGRDAEAEFWERRAGDIRKAISRKEAARANQEN